MLSLRGLLRQRVLSPHPSYSFLFCALLSLWVCYMSAAWLCCLLEVWGGDMSGEIVCEHCGVFIQETQGGWIDAEGFRGCDPVLTGQLNYLHAP